MSEEQTNTMTLEECGVVTDDTLMGLVMSTESAGIDEEEYNKAVDAWREYYDSAEVRTNFTYLLCHLICKADSFNLFRISKGFPELVRAWADVQLMSKADAEKLAEMEKQNEEKAE